MQNDQECTVRALDRNLRALTVGARVSFVMRGFFLPREQQMFGVVLKIDRFGGITIQTVSPYKHFISNKKVADVSNQIYFFHHRYDSRLGARVYQTRHQGHELFIEIFEDASSASVTDAKSPHASLPKESAATHAKIASDSTNLSGTKRSAQ